MTTQNKTLNKIACQPLLNNKELKIGSNSVYNNNLSSIGMWCVTVYRRFVGRGKCYSI